MMKIYHKFRAKPQICDEKRFDSKKERDYYLKLKGSQKNGDLIFFLRQVPFDLPGKVKYRADFMEFWDNGEVKVVDVKGYMTETAKIKIKQVKDLYNIDIQIV